MSKVFAGRVIAEVQKWRNGLGGAFLLKVTSVNGNSIKPVVVNISESIENLDRLELEGLSKGAMVAVMMENIAQHVPPIYNAEGKKIGGDNELRARVNPITGEKEGPTPIHRPINLVEGTTKILRSGTPTALVLETEPETLVLNKTLDACTGAIQKAMAGFLGENA